LFRTGRVLAVTRPWFHILPYPSESRPVPIPEVILTGTAVVICDRTAVFRGIIRVGTCEAYQFLRAFPQLLGVGLHILQAVDKVHEFAVIEAFLVSGALHDFDGVFLTAAMDTAHAEGVNHRSDSSGYSLVK
jgi:hypothetical protein